MIDGTHGSRTGPSPRNETLDRRARSGDEVGWQRAISELEDEIARLEQAKDWLAIERDRWMREAKSLRAVLDEAGQLSRRPSPRGSAGSSGGKGFLRDVLLPPDTWRGRVARMATRFFRGTIYRS